MGQEFSDEYKDYAMGLNLTNRMPLYVTPAQKIPLEATFAKMRAHYEGTALGAFVCLSFSRIY
jgi:dipeptidase